MSLLWMGLPPYPPQLVAKSEGIQEAMANYYTISWHSTNVGIIWHCRCVYNHIYGMGEYPHMCVWTTSCRANIVMDTLIGMHDWVHPNYFVGQWFISGHISSSLATSGNFFMKPVGESQWAHNTNTLDTILARYWMHALVFEYWLYMALGS